MADPLNRVLVEHTSATRRNHPGETHHLVPLGGGGGGELLDWVEETGDFKIWVGKDGPPPGANQDPYQAAPRISGRFPDIGPGHRLVWLASQLGLWDKGSGLDWVPDSGGRIFELDRSITSGDPMPVILNDSSFRIRPERELIYLDHERVLDWDRSTGDIQVWEYDRNAADTDPLPNQLNTTSYPNVLADHQIVYLGGDLLLIWNETSGDVEVWRYDRTVLGDVDPFPDQELSDSWAGEIAPGRQILYLGADRVLDWDPASGSHRIWSLDRPKTPTTQFDFLLNTDLDLAAPWIAVAQERIVAHQIALNGDGEDQDFDLTDDALRTHFKAQDHSSGLDFAMSAILDNLAGILERFSSGTGSISQVTKETAITDLQGVQNYTRGYTSQGTFTRLTPAYGIFDTVGSPGLDGAGSRLRAAILIHETVHFIGDNPDTALEWQQAKYAAMPPELAIRNPASYASFAHHVTEGFFLRFGDQPWI